VVGWRASDHSDIRADVKPFETNPEIGRELPESHEAGSPPAHPSNTAIPVVEDGERTKRLAAETVNELQARIRQLSELFEQAPGFMAVLRGPDHVFELANAASYQVIGRRDILGKPLGEALPELKEQGFIELMDRVLQSGEPYVGSDVEVRLQREPGAPLENRYVDLVFQPLVAVDGGVTGVFVQGNDVTARKRAEDALRAADRRKDEFLATLAHELRNPLAPIRHAAKISKSPDATEAQSKWAHDVIDRQVEHMARLLDDLLDVSRITSGRFELRKQSLVLQDDLIAAVETVRPLIETRGHRLTIELPSEPVHIDADPVRFAQIIANLLTNAAKYTDSGGVIAVRAGVEAQSVVVSVQDDGIGISPELLPRVFEMFSQSQSALERAEGGLGIGLSLVRGLVSLHGGSIEAKSRGLGQGSELVVTLPLSRGEPQPAGRGTASAASSAAAQTRVRVLVADDNRDSADSCALLLQLSGHDVCTAYSGLEALAIGAEFAPQLVLLDLGMPEMNGYEVARRIRAASWGTRVKLVAVTGWSQEEDKRQARIAGFDHHFAKPLDPDTLRDLTAKAAGPAIDPSDGRTGVSRRPVDWGSEG
jgi:PAS domain S-box-containing protein